MSESYEIESHLRNNKRQRETEANTGWRGKEAPLVYIYIYIYIYIYMRKISGKGDKPNHELYFVFITERLHQIKSF